MLRISCPFCGERDQTEFQYGGEAPIQRPAHPDACSDTEWSGYLFYRANLKGVHIERWVHGIGCRQWFLLARDTATHEIRAAFRLDETDPGRAPPEVLPNG